MAIAVAGTGLALVGAGCFSPKFENCAVFCGAEGQCPEDQFCLSDGRCHQSQDEELCTMGGETDGSPQSDASVDPDGGGRPDAGGDGGGKPDSGEIDAGTPVDPVNPGDIIITEIHKNPAAVLDEVGEWFELHNPTSLTFDLSDVDVLDESDPVEGFGIVDGTLIIPPGGYLVFARNPDPGLNGGVEEDLSYEDIMNPPFQLANDTTDEIILVNDVAAVELDRVAYDPVGFPDLAGASLSLDPDSIDAAENDVGANWCDGSAPFGDGDLGTPGQANPQCGAAVR